MQQNTTDFSLDLGAFSKSLVRPVAPMFDAAGDPLPASLPFKDLSGFRPVEEMSKGSEPVDPAIIAIPHEYTIVYALWPSQIYAGTVMAVSENFVVQDIGNKRAKLHRTRDLLTVPAAGAVVRINYVGGFGQVKVLPAR